jgi:ATP citrate (pro-S)-lyase
MAAKSIFEADGKAILNYHLTRAPVIKPTPLPRAATHNAPPKLASLHFPADADVKGVLDQAEATYPWLLTPGSKFVAKPDQLIKRRGKSGLLALNKSWADARQWIEERAGKPVKVETVDGVLRQFLVEPFVPHPQNTEYYININSVREVCSPFSSRRGQGAVGVPIVGIVSKNTHVEEERKRGKRSQRALRLHENAAQVSRAGACFV